MKMSKRLLGLALALCVTMTLIPGCAQQAQSQGEANGAGTSVQLSSSGDSAAPAEVESVSLDNRKLNVSVLQMPIFDTAAESLEYMNYIIEGLMWGVLRPELVVGVECGLGFEPQRIDSDFIEYLGAIAKRYQIYFIPGTFYEISDDLPEGEVYNTCPVFNPDGELIRVYRKKAPYYPVEEGIAPSSDPEYCIFEIEEKGITVGLQICYDQFFPEISRTLALEGAEIIICPSYDPAEFDHIPDVVPRCRALENELFYVWTNGVGGACGNSIIVDPEGKVIYKCDSTEMTYTTCLDFSEVTEKRLYGEDQHLNTLRYLGLDYPYAGKLDEAPVYQDWPELSVTLEDYDQRVSEIGINTMSREVDEELDARMDELMKSISN